MDHLFIFCFKGCLKGEHDGEYYEILEVENPRRATQDEIKRQYKKLSLNLHPDKLAQRGVEVTPELRQKFLKLKEAYEVLSDPKRRKVYDDLGELGLKISEGRAADINPLELIRNFQRNRQYRFSLYLCIFTVFAALFVLPVLFSLKADGTIGYDATWTAIWTPMWIVDVVLLLLSASLLCTSEVTATNEDGETVVIEKISLWERISSLLLTVVFVLLQIFITMRLDRDIRWSWFAVFIPWFIYEGLSLINLIHPAFLAQPVPPNHENAQLNTDEEGGGEEEALQKKLEAEMNYFKEITDQFSARVNILEHLLRVWLAIFLAVKLNHSVDWDWGLVLLPIWIYFFMKYALVFVYRNWAATIQKEHNIVPEGMQYETDPVKMAKYMQVESLYSSGSTTCFVQCAPLFMALMLISRLDVSSFSTFLILLPVFIILGCCCIAVCCAVICIASTNVDEAEEALKAQQQAAGSAGSASAAARDEESTYNPPAVFIGRDGDDSPSSVPKNNVNMEYGTFAVAPSSAAPSSPTAAPPVKEEATQPPAATNIDPDID